MWKYRKSNINFLSNSSISTLHCNDGIGSETIEKKILILKLIVVSQYYCSLNLKTLKVSVSTTI